MANNESNSELIKCTCGVPLNLHATCCGWANANLIIYPSNEQEREWQRLKLEATGMHAINEKIALFMCDAIEGRYFLFNYLKSEYKTGWYEIGNMSFHKSWDWLIPVYAKIYKQGFISKTGMALMLKHAPNFQNAVTDNNIETAINITLELIDFLNINNKHDKR